MPARPPRPGYDPWRDAAGAPIPQQCRIEQVAVGKSYGALPSRLHKQGQVLGRGVIRLSVLFDNEDTVVSIRPHLVRVVPVPSSPTSLEPAGSDCRG
jgi:hypothetical protein